MQDKSVLNITGWLVLLYFVGETVAYVFTGMLSRDVGMLYKAAFYAKFFWLIYYFVRVLCHIALPAILILTAKNKFGFLLGSLLFLVFGNTLDFNPLPSALIHFRKLRSPLYPPSHGMLRRSPRRWQQ